MTDVAGFFALAIVVIVTPGPDTALTIRNTLAGGRRSGLATAVGVALGQATWSIATGVATDAPPFLALLGLGLVFCVMTLAWLTAYAFAVARAGDVLRRGPVQRAIEAATGAVLIAFGVRVAVAAR